MTNEVYAGVDVSKKALDADWGKRKKVSNTAIGIGNLIREFKRAKVHLVVLESTGGYERALVEALSAAQIGFAVVNPRRTNAFAKSLGFEAKTDCIDAQILRLFAERMKPAAQTLPSERVQKLRYLLDRRTQLLDIIVMEKNRRKAPLGCAETRKSIALILKVLNKEKKAIEGEVAKIIEQNEDLKMMAEAVQVEKGVGPILTLALLADMPELGTLNRAQVAALTGVAPFDNQSGRTEGVRRIKGGRKRFRQVLYMATVCAVRRNPYLKHFYLALVKRGKKKIVALVAAMRKFIIRLNSLVRKLKSENQAMAFAFA